MLIPARSVSSFTSETNVDLDQSITLEDEMMGFSSAAKIWFASTALKISGNRIFFITAFSFSDGSSL